MNAHFLYQNRPYADAITYAARLLLDALDLQVDCRPYDGVPETRSSIADDADLVVSYGRQPPEGVRGRHLHIVEGGLFGPAFLCPCSLPTGPPTIFGGVPIVFAADGQPVVREGDRLTTGLDLIASSLFLASRYEEFLRPERDEYDRFETRSAYAYRHGFGDRPVVEAYVALLRDWLRELGLPVARRRMIPEHEFAVCLTHDLDQLTRGWLEAGFHELKQVRRPLRSALNIARLAYDKARGRDPYWNFDAMLGMEERRAVRSCLYFLPQTGHPMDARYDWHQERFGPLFRRLRDEGWEIGLHGSYDSARDERMLALQRRGLEEISQGPVYGVRQHYLRFLVQDGWRRQQEAGFLYDSTLGYADDAGFRGGLARPFQPFDLIARRKLDLWEVPLVIMDQTFRTYLKLPVEKVWERMAPVLEQVKAHRGAAAVLWHNTFFAGYKFAGFERVYDRMLEWVAANGGICTTAEQAVRWWQGR